jgi:CheY-like chemotaxis protein
MAAAALSIPSEDAHEVTPWVLIVGAACGDREDLRRKLERSGCAVEEVSTRAEALAYLAVITPALIVLEGFATSPRAGDFLDRSRLIGVDAARDGDMVREQLAEHGKRNGGQLFRQA